MGIFRYERRIRETDLDFLGHVNHAKYLSMLEEARWEMISDRGYGLGQLQKAMISPVILQVNIQYKKEICNRERIVIETHTKMPSSKVGTLEQIARNENGDIAAIATITYGIMDLEQRGLIHPPTTWLEAIGVENAQSTDS